MLENRELLQILKTNILNMFLHSHSRFMLTMFTGWHCHGAVVFMRSSSGRSLLKFCTSRDIGSANDFCPQHKQTSLHRWNDHVTRHAVTWMLHCRTCTSYETRLTAVAEFQQRYDSETRHTKFNSIKRNNDETVGRQQHLSTTQLW